MADRTSKKSMTPYEMLSGFSERVAQVDGEQRQGRDQASHEASLRLVLSNAPFGVMLLAPDLSILYMNVVAAALLDEGNGVPEDWAGVGRAMAAETGETLADLVRFEDGQQTERSTGVMELHTQDGVRSVDFRSCRLQDGRIVVGFADITERRNVVKDLQRSHKKLERMVHERTRDLVAANNAKRDFLANMSHELRTPLNGILGMSEILRDTALDEEQRICLSAIRQAGHEMLRIVSNLLDVSKAEAGRLVLRPRNFALRSSLEQVITLFRRRALTKGLSFSSIIEADIPEEINADPDRLKQLVFNLLDNAVKFTQSGGVSLSIRLGTSSASGRIPLRIEVSDTGPGIEAEAQEHIFESFFLGEELMTKKHAGAGLGLPIARHIAMSMGGGVRLESNKRRGSLFVAELMAAPANGLWTDRSAMRRVEPPTLGPLKILLVEDEEVSRMYARLMLDKMGHIVVMAENGVAALQRLGAEDFDLVITDIQMPKMDGVTAVEHIRGVREGYEVRDPAIPVVALTVFAHNDARERILAADVDEYVTKPVESKRLTEAMRNALARRGRKA
ncbi:response regulator [Oceanidesulfovibrio marinus]|uniref:histidine kinase n=1 Tax=Oceanidesulfovibrio marinus TaxID=370038 RepID=A0A6P1ZHZ0_9BACT|nr:response regulator [Oceanidesulfovibrio marinus]QJT08674.1 response regulator [Oceanidesulfovibrio marinus]TVM32490.1 hybrid sensor histidine kinase/response regulator [Oceanidesulfovibrio marinus]